MRFKYIEDEDIADEVESGPVTYRTWRLDVYVTGVKDYRASLSFDTRQGSTEEMVLKAREAILNAEGSTWLDLGDIWIRASEVSMVTQRAYEKIEVKDLPAPAKRTNKKMISKL